MKKIYPDAAAALEGLLFDGMTICAGGFGLCGIPERLIDAIQASGRQGPDHRLATMPASTMRASASCCAPARSGR